MKRALNRCLFNPSVKAPPVYVYLPYGTCLAGNLLRWGQEGYRLSVNDGQTSVTFSHRDVIGVNVGTGRSFWLRGSEVPDHLPGIKPIPHRKFGFARAFLAMLKS